LKGRGFSRAPGSPKDRALAPDAKSQVTLNSLPWCRIAEALVTTAKFITAKLTTAKFTTKSAKRTIEILKPNPIVA
jgi:hypothetical protein